jgi:hypothetical protein
LSLSLAAPATFSPFLPGLAQAYETSVLATVTSSARDSALSVADPSSTATGRLTNGAYSLTQALEARARNAANQNTAFAPVSGSPLTLLTYPEPVGTDSVTIGLRQTILATEALRTGLYSKTLTFTLSTTMP